MKKLKDVILDASAHASLTAISELFRKEVSYRGGKPVGITGAIKRGSSFSFLDFSYLRFTFSYKGATVLIKFSPNAGQWHVTSPGLTDETCQTFDAMFKKIDKGIKLSK